MVPVVCRTNLDLRVEDWPGSLPALPHIGDLIQSVVKRGVVQLELRVCNITWKYSERFNWYAEIELHLPENRFLNIRHFENWYDHLCGLLSHESYLERDKQIRTNAYNSQL